MSLSKVDSLLMNWSKKKYISGKSFDEICQIEEVPLWWFLNRIFVPHIMPKRINMFKEMDKNKSISFLKKKKLNFWSKILTKAIYYNELRKIKKISKKKIEQNKLKKGVLFLSYNDHIQKGENFRLKNIIKELSKKEENEFEPIELIVDSLSNHKINPQPQNKRNFYQYVPKKNIYKANKNGKELSRKWKKINQKLKGNLFTDSTNKSIWKYVEPGLNFLISKEFISLINLYYQTFLRIFYEENIKAVVLTSQNSIFDKCVIAVAKNCGVPVLRIQHGIAVDLVPPDGGDCDKSMYKLVFSDNVKKELMDVGWDENKLIVVGSLIFDDIGKISKTLKENNEIIFLIATSPFVETNLLSENEYRTKIETILRSIEKINAGVIIKLHPHETSKEAYQRYKFLLSNVNLKTKIIAKPQSERSEFYKQILSSTVVIQFGSTVAVEAMILNKPVLTINLMEGDFMTGWLRNNTATTYIDNIFQIDKALKDSMHDTKEKRNEREEYVLKKCGVVDGKSYLRVVETIKLLS